MIGIYKITNKLNGKYYLGSSKNIENRWKEHANSLKGYRHHSIHLQRAWDKHGEANFTFDIAKTCKEAELIDTEQSFLDEKMPWKRSIGYNISRTATGCALYGEDNGFYGKKHTESAKLAMSRSKKIKYIGCGNPQYGKPCYWKGKKRLDQSARMTGEKHPAFGKPRPEEAKKKQSEKMKGKHVGGKSILAKRIVQFTINGEMVAIFESLSEASRDTGANLGSICSACKGKLRSAGGYKWMYIEEYQLTLAI